MSRGKPSRTLPFALSQFWRHLKFSRVGQATWIMWKNRWPSSWLLLTRPDCASILEPLWTDRRLPLPAHQTAHTGYL